MMVGSSAWAEADRRPPSTSASSPNTSGGDRVASPKQWAEWLTLWQPPTPDHLRGAVRILGIFFPVFRLALIGVAVAVAIALWILVDRTRLGAMIRAGVDDPPIARVVGINVSRLFTLIFCLGAALAAFAGVMAAPFLSVYPGLDAEMLPLALIVVILGGIGSLPGAFIGSFIIGFIYTFGTALFPELAYIILFLPMIVVIAFRPQGLFGRAGA